MTDILDVVADLKPGNKVFEIAGIGHTQFLDHPIIKRRNGEWHIHDVFLTFLCGYDHFFNKVGFRLLFFILSVNWRNKGYN